MLHSFVCVLSGTPSVLLGKPLVKGSAKGSVGGFSLNKGAQGGKGGKEGKGERGQGHHSKSSFSSSSSSSSLDAQGHNGNASNLPLDGRDGRDGGGGGRDGRDGRDGDSKDSRDSKDGSRADGGRVKGSGSHRSRDKGGGGGLKGASKGGYSYSREGRESHVYNGYSEGRGRDREKEAKQQSKQQSLPKSALLIPDTELSFIYCKVRHEGILAHEGQHMRRCIHAL